jgi:hypothetical protein
VEVVLTTPEYQVQMRPIAGAVGASVQVMEQECISDHIVQACSSLGWGWDRGHGRDHEKA